MLQGAVALFEDGKLAGYRLPDIVRILLSVNRQGRVR
jgi:hypothetical protein